MHVDAALGFRAIRGDSDAVDEIGDGDAEAAADDETVRAANHPNDLITPERLQTELPKTVLA